MVGLRVDLVRFREGTLESHSEALAAARAKAEVVDDEISSLYVEPAGHGRRRGAGTAVTRERPRLDGILMRLDAEAVAAVLVATSPVSLEDALAPAQDGGLREAQGFYAWWVERATIADVPHHPNATKPRATTKKVGLDRDDDARLRKWQFDHLSLTWCERTRPWAIENRVIAVMQPPLNCATNETHPFYQRVISAREAFWVAGRNG